MPDSALPAPEADAEDAWVAAWTRADDPAGLLDAINAAMDARRPQLGARLVGLLGDQVQVEPGSALARAQQAARLLLHQSEPAQWSPAAEAFLDAWKQARDTRMSYVIDRMRRQAREPAGVLGTVSTTRRKPRLTGRKKPR